MDKTTTYHARVGRIGDVGLLFDAGPSLEHAIHWLAMNYTPSIGYGEVREVNDRLGPFGYVVLVLERDGVEAWRKRDATATRWETFPDERTRHINGTFAGRANDPMWTSVEPPRDLGRFDCAGHYRHPAEETPATMAMRHAGEAARRWAGLHVVETALSTDPFALRDSDPIGGPQERRESQGIPGSVDADGRIIMSPGEALSCGVAAVHLAWAAIAEEHGWTRSPQNEGRGSLIHDHVWMQRGAEPGLVAARSKWQGERDELRALAERKGFVASFPSGAAAVHLHCEADPLEDRQYQSMVAARSFLNVLPDRR